jgi:ABC-type Fe3+ transport system permease subunit
MKEGGNMLFRVVIILVATFVLGLQTLFPSGLWAGSGGEVTEIVVVADTRMVSNGFLKYIADTYNTNLPLFGLWAVALTAMYGGALGFLMDWLMSKTGLDLRNRKIIEH